MNKKSLYTMCALYLFAGTMHFIRPDSYLKIMPDWIPAPEAMVYASGVCEILFALLLLHPLTRRLGAWCIIVLLIAIFPANIQMLVTYFVEHNKWLWLTVVRLPFQVELICWSYYFTRRKSTTSF